MKKLLLLTAIIALTVSTASAQLRKTDATIANEKNTIGVRVGYGADISYQRYLQSNNRIEADLGFGYESSFDVSAVYQWLFGMTIDNVGFNWYAGLGAGLGVWEDDFAVSAVGQIGIEYKFNAPITLSLDWKPRLYMVPDIDFGWTGFGLGVRYRF